jgi:hypothetical protein
MHRPRKSLVEITNPCAGGRPRSLKKTESQHKMSTYKTNQTFSNTGFNFDPKSAAGKLSKTTNNFYRKPEPTSQLVTYYPYIENYFQPLPKECHKFKELCLTPSLEKHKFFENEIFKVTIAKENA